MVFTKDVIDEFVEEEKEPSFEDTSEETIFEEKEEEIPTPLIAQSAFILKVISGPNAGSEFEMDKSKTYITCSHTHAVDSHWHIVFQQKNAPKIP